MVGARPAEMDTTQLGQAVVELGLEVAPLVSRDGLLATEARYPVGEKGA